MDSSNSSSAPSWRTKLQSPTTLVAVAALAVGAVGAKFLWADSPAVKVPVAAATVNKPAAAKGGAGAKATPAKNGKLNGAAGSARAGSNNVSARSANRNAGDETVATDAAAAAPALAQSVAIPRPKPVRGDLDTTSDTEGLFTMAALEQGAGPDRGHPRVSVGGTDLGERVTSSTGVAPAAPDPLGPTFIDEHNGFSIRFPISWSMRTFAGDPWVLDCGDGRTALISIGFSPFPAEFTADNIPPEWVARRVNKRPDTVLHAQGTATIHGRKALWSKSTGPLPMSNAQPRMTRQTYILPLGDGRVMEIRIAALPEQFERIAVIMKKSIASMRLIAPSKPATAVAKTE